MFRASGTHLVFSYCLRPWEASAYWNWWCAWALVVDWCFRGQSRKWVGACRGHHCALQGFFLHLVGSKYLARYRQLGGVMSHNVSLLTLVLPVASLYLFMLAFLHLSLQDSCPGWLVVVGSFQNVGGIYVVVSSSSHDVIPIDIELEDWDLQNDRVKLQIWAIEHVSGQYLHRCRWQSICHSTQRLVPWWADVPLSHAVAAVTLWPGGGVANGNAGLYF